MCQVKSFKCNVGETIWIEEKCAQPPLLQFHEMKNKLMLDINLLMLDILTNMHFRQVLSSFNHAITKSEHVL